MRSCPIGKRKPPPHCQGSSLESCHGSYSSSTMDAASTKLEVASGSIGIIIEMWSGHSSRGDFTMSMSMRPESPDSPLY